MGGIIHKEYVNFGPLGPNSQPYYLRRNIGDGTNPYALNMGEPFPLSVARKPVFWVPSLKMSIHRLAGAFKVRIRKTGVIFIYNCAIRSPFTCM